MKDPEVAAVLEDDFVRRGVRLMKGARADGVDRRATASTVPCDDGRVVAGSHALLAIGSIPNSDGLGLEAAGVESTRPATCPSTTTASPTCRTSMPPVTCRASCRSPRSPPCRAARSPSTWSAGTRVAHRTSNYDKAASAIFTEPEIADVGLAEADAFAEGRKIRVTKVPFAASARALIDNDPRGFVKIVSDPATGVVLGGSIVGQHAAELISVLAVAVTAGLRVQDIVESMLVHPALAEALAEAAE